MDRKHYFEVSYLKELFSYSSQIFAVMPTGSFSGSSPFVLVGTLFSFRTTLAYCCNPGDVAAIDFSTLPPLWLFFSLFSGAAVNGGPPLSSLIYSNTPDCGLHRKVLLSIVVTPTPTITLPSQPVLGTRPPHPS